METCLTCACDLWVGFCLLRTVDYFLLTLTVDFSVPCEDWFLVCTVTVETFLILFLSTSSGMFLVKVFS